MIVSPQAYVRGSMEAAQAYCRAFGATVSYAALDETGKQYLHCELSRDGAVFLALSEAPAECDTSPKRVWQTMAFNVARLADHGVQCVSAARPGGSPECL